ncbi:MAG: hypothetical protein OXK76_03640 [Gammaproteobacteria bacterium]|nr:hypothetical protein [Gammaproteobacteria bacterium]
MDEKTFEDALDRFGPHLDRWPANLATAARSLVDDSAGARRLLGEARELDAALDEVLPSVAAPLGLRTRILANLPEREAWFEWLTIRVWRTAALALVPLVVGFGIGLNVAQGAAVAEEAAEHDVLLALFDPDELARFELPGPETGTGP